MFLHPPFASDYGRLGLQDQCKRWAGRALTGLSDVHMPALSASHWRSVVLSVSSIWVTVCSPILDKAVPERCTSVLPSPFPSSYPSHQASLSEPSLLPAEYLILPPYLPPIHPSPGIPGSRCRVRHFPSTICTQHSRKPNRRPSLAPYYDGICMTRI
jgi:hypothetical protein